MGKVANDFKINNTHNNTGQLLIFIYLFITSYPSLFMAAFLIRQLVCSALLCKMFSFTFSQIINLSASSLFFLFLLILLVSSVRQICLEENLPQSTEATCALWPVQLRLGSHCWLHPVVCQAAKQGKRWDKWLFMICHLPSSRLSPGPIHYCCRLPLCLTRHVHKHTHTQILSTRALG